MDIARNERKLSFVMRNRSHNSCTTDQRTLQSRSRLKSISISKSVRIIVMSLQSTLAMASVDRSGQSNTAISPKRAPGFKTARASSPELGTSREMRTSPLAMINNWLSGLSSLKIFSLNLNDYSEQISAMVASSSSSMSAKTCTFLSIVRSIRGRSIGGAF